jgi:hypothetical protein
MRRSNLIRWLALPLLSTALTAHAIPPPPPPPPQLGEAQMTVTVRLIEASHGRVSKATPLCEVGGAVPVFAGDGYPAQFHEREIWGCTMRWKGQRLPVSVQGAAAVAHGSVTFATASVSVVPPDAAPLCPGMCGLQPLADSRGKVKVSGTPRSLTFGLTPNTESLLNARPTVWLEADVTITRPIRERRR